MENKRFFTPDEKEFALARQEFVCGGECGDDLWQEPLGYCQGHHILPFAMSGATVIENLVILCPNCHIVHDNMAVCGQMYGGYDIKDMQPEQIRDQELFERSVLKARENAKNPKIQKTIFKYNKKVYGR